MTPGQQSDEGRPTFAMRWLQRWHADVIIDRDFHGNLFPGAKETNARREEWVLQQAWVMPSGRVVWQDIPREYTQPPA